MHHALLTIIVIIRDSWRHAPPYRSPWPPPVLAARPSSPPAGDAAREPRAEPARSTWSPRSTRCSSSPSGSAATRSRSPTWPSRAPSRTTWSSTRARSAQISDAELVVYLRASSRPWTRPSRRRRRTARSTSPRGRAAARRRRGRARPRARARSEHAEAAGGKDPHVWLDPTRLADDRRRARRAARPRPTRRTPPTTRARAAALRAELDDARHASSRPGCETCQRREIVTSHAAFGYLADRYGLTRSASPGSRPEAEPTPQRLAEVAEEAREHRRHHDLLRDAGQPEGRRDHRHARSAPRPRCSIRSKG